MIYCVVPQELVNELYGKLVAYYQDNPDVTVIVDRRRRGPDRRASDANEVPDERRVVRDRRRARVVGTFPNVEVSAAD